MDKIDSESENSKICTENIYIKRKSREARNIIEDDDIETLLAKYNFKKISMEELTLREQIKLMKNAKNVIAPHGAGLTHIVNMMEQTKVIEVMPSDSIHPLYWFLAETAKLEYAMIPSAVVNEKQDMKVNIKVLESEIKQLGI